jgi:hypothetical protein
MTGYDILSYSRKISKYLGSVKKIPDYAVILQSGVDAVFPTDLVSVEVLRTGLPHDWLHLPHPR